MVHRPAPFPDNEEERVSSLEHLDVLDSEPEANFEDVVLLARSICDVPIALVSLVDHDRQWFKACIGLDVRETHRDFAFCAHAVLEPAKVMIVEDATQDPRFHESPLVLGPPFIRFYAGAPILTDTGDCLGTVCVIDTQRRTLTENQQSALLALARQTASLLQLRLLEREREQRSIDLEQALSEAIDRSLVAESSLKQAQRVASLGMLTAKLSHDFNNLLQVLSASLQMIQLRARRPADVERLSDTGLRAVEQGRQLVNQLMQGLRSDHPDPLGIDVCTKLQTWHDLLLRSVGDDIDLSLDVQNARACVYCDDVQLQAAVLNLLSNARQAMQNVGWVRVSTHVEQVSNDVLAEGKYLVLSVADGGPGMGKQIARKALDPFFTTKALGAGTGLGLAQVQDFAAGAGGGVQIDTSPGKGTTVRMYLRILDTVPVSSESLKAGAQ